VINTSLDNSPISLFNVSVDRSVLNWSFFSSKIYAVIDICVVFFVLFLLTLSLVLILLLLYSIDTHSIVSVL